MRLSIVTGELKLFNFTYTGLLFNITIMQIGVITFGETAHIFSGSLFSWKYTTNINMGCFLYFFKWGKKGIDLPPW